MTENKKDPNANNPKIAAIEQFNDRLKKRMETKSPTSFIEGVGILFSEISAITSEIEASKSPEQKAREAEQAKIRTNQQQLEATKEKTTERELLLKEWLQRDTWIIYSEALHLSMGKKPSNSAVIGSNNPLWDLVQSCAGHSLMIANPKAQPKEWRVKSSEWVRWLKQKEQYIHPQLEDLLFPKSKINPTNKTAIATQSREIIKRDRHTAIRNFSVEAQTLAKMKNIDWSNQDIPVTKKDFFNVFCSKHRQYKNISEETYHRDFSEIGLIFKRGTKSNKNNVLKVIFSIG